MGCRVVVGREGRRGGVPAASAAVAAAMDSTRLFLNKFVVRELRPQHGPIEVPFGVRLVRAPRPAPYFEQVVGRLRRVLGVNGAVREDIDDACCPFQREGAPCSF